MTSEQVVAALFKNVEHAAALFPAEPSVDGMLAAHQDMAVFPRFAWGSPFLSNPKLARRLHRVSAPTLVVSPEEDKVIPLEHGRRYAELIPKAEHTVVEDCGHAMYFEKPEESAAVTGDFLARTAKPIGAGR